MTNDPYSNMNQPGAQPPWGGQPQQNYPHQGQPQQNYPHQGQPKQGYFQQPQGYLHPQQQNYSQPYGAPGYMQPPRPPGGGAGRTVLLVLIGVLVVALGLGIWWFITNNSKSTAPSTPTPTAASPTPTATETGVPELPKKFGDFNYSETIQKTSFYHSSDGTQIMAYTDSPSNFEDVRNKLTDPTEKGDFTCGPQEISLKNNKKVTMMMCITTKKHDRLLILGTVHTMPPQQLAKNGKEFLEAWK